MRDFGMPLTTIIRRLTTVLALMVLPLAAHPSWSAHHEAHEAWMGDWSLSDTKGNPYTLKLHMDGSADNDWGGGEHAGRWSMQDNGSILVEMDNGWHIVLSKEDGGVVKRSYAPGVDMNAAPSSISPAGKQKHSGKHKY